MLIVVAIVIGVVYSRPSLVYFGLGSVAITIAAVASAFLVRAKPLTFDLLHATQIAACPAWVKEPPSRWPHDVTLVNGDRRATVVVSKHAVDVGPDGAIRTLQFTAESPDQRVAVDAARELAKCLRLSAPPMGQRPDAVDAVEFDSGAWHVDFETWNLRFPNTGSNKWDYGVRLTLRR